MKNILFLIFGFCLIHVVVAQDKEEHYPYGGFRIGISDRFNQPVNKPINITYVHQSSTLKDTFNYSGQLKSKKSMTTFVMGMEWNWKYFGCNVDFGFVPFAKRTNHYGVSLYGLIPLKKDVLSITPFIGYTNLRKIFKLGWLEEGNNKLMIGSNAYSSLKIRAIDNYQSYNYGLNIIYKRFLSINITHQVVFDNYTAIKVLGYKSNGTKLINLFFDSVIPEDVKTYKSDGSRVVFADQNNQKVNKLIQPSPWSVSIIFTIDPNNIDFGEGRPIRRWFGVQ